MATQTTATSEAAHSAEPINRTQLYIGGQWVDPSGDGVLVVIESTTEQVMGQVPEGTPEDVDRAVKAARAAFDDWSQTSLAERADACRAIGAAMAARSEE